MISKLRPGRKTFNLATISTQTERGREREGS